MDAAHRAGTEGRARMIADGRSRVRASGSAAVTSPPYSSGLKDVLLRALSKEKDERFPSASDFATAFADALGRKPPVPVSVTKRMAGAALASAPRHSTTLALARVPAGNPAKAGVNPGVNPALPAAIRLARPARARKDHLALDRGRMRDPGARVYRVPPHRLSPASVCA